MIIGVGVFTAFSTMHGGSSLFFLHGELSGKDWVGLSLEG